MEKFLENASGFGDLISDVVDTRDCINMLTVREKEQINLCKTIRRAVASNCVIVDEGDHNKHTNGVLYDFVRACGYEVREFVIRYLSVLQPYSIVRYSQQEFDKQIRCVIDPTYKIPMYLKIDITQHNEVVISFHENQFTRLRDLTQNQSKYFVLLSDDSYTDNCVGITMPFKSSILKGFASLVYEGVGCLVGVPNIFKIDKASMDSMIQEFISAQLERCAVDIPYNEIMPNDLTFTAYGDHVLNSMSLLIDSYCSVTSPGDRAACMYGINSILADILKSPECDMYFDVINKRYAKVQSKHVTTLLDYFCKVVEQNARLD